jgi:hypothetical protein
VHGRKLADSPEQIKNFFNVSAFYFHRNFLAEILVFIRVAGQARDIR